MSRLKLHQSLLWDGAAIAALSIAVWLAYFQFSSDLGLYQDDVFMYQIVQNAKGGALKEAFDFVRGYGGEGRYGNQVLMVLLTAFGKEMAGVTGLYVVGWMVLSIEVALAFVFFRQIFPYAVSLLAAAFVALFPADTAKFFAVSYMGNVTAILFFLAGILALRGRHIGAAIALTATSIISEAYIPIGLAIPVLLLARGRAALAERARDAGRFALTYVIVLVPVVIWRFSGAPGRARDAVASEDKWSLIERVFEAMILGPSASLSSLYKRVPEFFAQVGSASGTSAVLVFLIIVLLIGANDACRQGAREGSAPGPESVFTTRDKLAIAAFALLAMAAAYPLYGLYPARFPPTVIDGKMSNIHGPAAVGFAAILALVLNEVRVRTGAGGPLRRIVEVAVAAYLALIAGYFVLVQSRYVDNWRYQLAFFRHLPAAVPELQSDALVVVEPIGREAVRLEGGSPFDWTMPYLFQFMWKVPATWERTPMIISKYFWDTTARQTEGHVEISGYPTIPSRRFSRKDVTWLTVRDGHIYRSDGPERSQQANSFELPMERPSAAGAFRPGELQWRAAGASLGSSYQFVVPNNFSGAGWKNGIMVNPGERNDLFYFVVRDRSQNPFSIGDTVEFAGAGRARITRVDVAEQGGMFAVFVQVNLDLDPARDGYPSKIRYRAYK